MGIVRDELWFIIGDLNEITGNHEKVGGPLHHADSFLCFNHMIQNCGLMEFPSLGNIFFWRGRRGGMWLNVALIEHWGIIGGITCSHAPLWNIWG